MMRFLALFTLVFVSSACAESAPIAPGVSDEQILASLSARHFDPERPSEALTRETARARLEALPRWVPDAAGHLAARAAAALRQHGARASARCLLLDLAEKDEAPPGLREAALRSLGSAFADREKARLLALSERLSEHPSLGVAREARLLGV